MSDTRILIVDDHPMIRHALATTLKDLVPGTVVFEAGTVEEMQATLAREKSIDLLTLDLSMPGAEGLSSLIELKTQRPEVPVTIVSAITEPAVVRKCIAFGAAGYIFKSLPQDGIRTACKAILDGHIWTPPGVDLQPKETKVEAELLAKVQSLGEGLLNKQIAYKLQVSEATIKAHVSAILQKLGVDSRTQAVIAIAKLSSTDMGAEAN
jgi:DNA-binding NarL/FixJ family response regulator